MYVIPGIYVSNITISAASGGWDRWGDGLAVIMRWYGMGG